MSSPIGTTAMVEEARDHRTTASYDHVFPLVVSIPIPNSIQTMPPAKDPKAKSDVKILKGQDAEDLVLDYVKRVPPRFRFINSPIAATDNFYR